MLRSSLGGRQASEFGGAETVPSTHLPLPSLCTQADRQEALWHANPDPSAPVGRAATMGEQVEESRRLDSQPLVCSVWRMP
mmetsp:Transcript_8179/g.14581  ORF Transcript_8179/g.14581 Transcript_8179/m.14581 type:complete len:81 (-) Transcript_8179:2045-2287(-)